MRALVSHHQKPPPAVDGNKYRDPQPDLHREKETLKHTALNMNSLPNLSSQSSGNSAEDWVG